MLARAAGKAGHNFHWNFTFPFPPVKIFNVSSEEQIPIPLMAGQTSRSSFK